jgi:Flp pilus assembly protein CpaB
VSFRPSSVHPDRKGSGHPVRNLPIMSERATSLIERDGWAEAISPGPRVVARRRVLPGGRAVLGGLLVSASAVGLFAAYDASHALPTTSYVVAAREVRPGQVLTAGDLEVVAIDLPPAQRAVSFTDRRRLVGTVALARMRAGELVQSADVADRIQAATRAEISVAVEPGAAMNGDRQFLRGGERVDVIATFTQGGSPRTVTVASNALVVGVLDDDRGLGNSGRITIVLSVAPDDLEAVAGASAVGTITLARTTGLRR